MKMEAHSQSSRAEELFWKTRKVEEAVAVAEEEEEEEDEDDARKMEEVEEVLL
jgi:hypothetical protein